VAWVGIYEVDVLVQGEGLGACVVEFCAPERGAGLVGCWGCGGGVEAVLFAAEGADCGFLVQLISWGCVMEIGDVHSSIVMSEVQHNAFAGLVGFAGVNGVVHFAANFGLSKMSVVLCKSHKSCLHTKPRSLVKATSHSRIPAPIRAPAS
jgi:hypothetical protein